MTNYEDFQNYKYNYNNGEIATSPIIDDNTIHSATNNNTPYIYLPDPEITISENKNQSLYGNINNQNYQLNNNSYDDYNSNYYNSTDYGFNQVQNNNFDFNYPQNKINDSQMNNEFSYLFDNKKNDIDGINNKRDISQEYSFNNNPKHIYTDSNSKIIEDFHLNNIINNGDLIQNNIITIPNAINVINEPKSINQKIKIINNNGQIKRNQLDSSSKNKDLIFKPDYHQNSKIINKTNEAKEIQNKFNGVKVVPIKSDNILDNQKEKSQNTDIVEVTDSLNYLELVSKEVKYRPLTIDDYNHIYLRGIGIINLGNTCFINSCLQVLIHCKLFIQNFFNKSNIIKKESNPISYQFLLICIAILDVKSNEERYIDISHFKEAFGKKHSSFNGFSQNDSQEFCRVFLDDLSTELNEAKNKNIYKALTNPQRKSKIDRDKEFDFNFKEREKSIITDLFYSQIITTFTCECGSEIYSFQKILDFPLLLPENNDKININDLLKIYFKNEIIDFETKCEKCHQIRKHKKTLRISRPPEILILSFQRINETTKQKNQCQIVFKPELNINEYIDHDCGFDQESEYKLFAVINHQGEIDCGHYFSYIQPMGSNKWYESNDSFVREIKVSITTVYKEAYVLFFIKKKYK